MKELIAFIKKKPLSAKERSLAHYQAEKLVHELEKTFWDDGYHMYPPYSYFSYSELIPVESLITYDLEKFPGQGTFLSMSPAHVRIAAKGEKIVGKVIESWTDKYYPNQHAGLYLYRDFDKGD